MISMTFKKYSALISLQRVIDVFNIRLSTESNLMLLIFYLIKLTLWRWLAPSLRSSDRTCCILEENQQSCHCRTRCILNPPPRSSVCLQLSMCIFPPPLSPTPPPWKLAAPTPIITSLRQMWKEFFLLIIISLLLLWQNVFHNTSNKLYDHNYKYTSIHHYHSLNTVLFISLTFIKIHRILYAYYSSQKSYLLIKFMLSLSIK